MNGDMYRDLGPDIEVEADRREEEQAILAYLQEGGREPGDEFEGVNSCDALRIIDGVAPEVGK